MFLLLFTVLLIKDILDLAWHLATRMSKGEQNWDLFGTISGLWSQLAQTFPNEHCSCYLDFSFPRPNFPKPRPRLFSETKTETFFRDLIFSKPKPRLFFQNQILRNQYQNPPKIGKSLETETKTETSQYP